MGPTGQPEGVNVRFGYRVVTPVANASTPTAIAYSEGYGYGGFSVAPVVMVAPNSGRPDLVRMYGTNAVDTGGCQLIIYRTNTSSTGLHWIAIGS